MVMRVTGLLSIGVLATTATLASAQTTGARELGAGGTVAGDRVLRRLS